MPSSWLNISVSFDPEPASMIPFEICVLLIFSVSLLCPRSMMIDVPMPCIFIEALFSMTKSLPLFVCMPNAVALMVSYSSRPAVTLNCPSMCTRSCEDPVMMPVASPAVIPFFAQPALAVSVPDCD